MSSFFRARLFQSGRNSGEKIISQEMFQTQGMYEIAGYFTVVAVIYSVYVYTCCIMFEGLFKQSKNSQE